MDKCRHFSQQVFGTKQRIKYEILENEEIMDIQKSKVIVCLNFFRTPIKYVAYLYSLEKSVICWLRMGYLEENIGETIKKGRRRYKTFSKQHSECLNFMFTS